MKIHLFLDNGHGGLGDSLGNVTMPIPPRIGEAIFVPGIMNHKRVVDVFWQPDESFDVYGNDGNDAGTKTWANIVVKHNP